MSWLTAIWYFAFAACAALGLAHLAIGLRRGARIAHLLFGTAALAASVDAIAELAMFKSSSVAAYAAANRISLSAVSLMIIAMVWYEQAYAARGRRSLAIAVTTAWTLVLAAVLTSPFGTSSRAITGLRTVRTRWGETFVVAQGSPSRIGLVMLNIADLLLVAFLVDIAVATWKRGHRWRAFLVTFGVGGLIAAAVLQAHLIDRGVLQMPYVVSLVYLAIVTAAGYPLTAAVVSAADTERKLREREAGLIDSQVVALHATSQALDAEEKFRLVVEAAPSGMILVDARGNIELVNAQTEALFGYGRDELVGLPVETLVPKRFGTHGDDRIRYQARPVARAMGSRRDLFGRRKDGSEFPVEISLSPVRTAEGVYVLASVLDISERRRTALELEQQRNEVAHLSRATLLGEIAGSLAHELNQPLTAILANAQAAQRFLKRDPPDLSEIPPILNDIVHDDKHAGEVIARLRGMLRKGEMQRERLNLSEVVTDGLRLARSELLQHGVSAETELDFELPPIDGDRVQLLQVLLNLIVNACDAMSAIDPAKRRLLIRTEPGNPGGVHLTVTDHGIGLPADELDRIFDPFVTTKGQGMGLGLSVCRTIVSAHGGRIWAVNVPGGGATFHLSLPGVTEQ